MFYSVVRKRCIRSIYFIFITLISTSLQAGLLEEIIVTAQKREESVQSVGIAITAFSAEQIDQLGFTNAMDIAELSPGVYVSGSSGGQNAQFSIRGATQNDLLDVIEGTTAVYLDEGYFVQQNSGAFGMFDIERVEILKGPQGTLFGRNATAGLVHYITKKPTQEAEGYLDVTYGDYDLVNVHAALSGPLSDKVQARGALFYNRHDNIFDNQFPLDAVNNGTGVVTGGGQDHWNDDSIAGRLQLNIDVNEDVNIYLMGHGSKATLGDAPYQSAATIAVFDASGNQVNTLRVSPTETREAIGPGGVNIPQGFGPRPVAGGDFFGFVDPDGEDFIVSKDYSFDDSNVFELYGFNGKLTWDINSQFSLSAISDYKQFDRTISLETNASPTDQFPFGTQTDTSSFTQEIRLNGESDRLRWITGVYFLTADANVLNGFIFPSTSIFTPVVGGVSVGASNSTNVISLETQSYSIFGQVDYNLSEKVTLIGGLRIIREEKDYSLLTNLYANTDVLHHTTDIIIAPGLASTATAPGEAYKEDTNDTLWTGKLGVNYQSSDDLLIYASINRGVKAGAFNASISGPLPPEKIGYDEEVLLSYEVGFKSTIFNGTSRLNASVYYYDYNDYHAFNWAGISGEVTNVDAESYGIDVEFLTNPIEGFDMMLSISAFDFSIDDFSIAPGVLRDVKPSYAADLTFAGLARYQWPAFNGNMSAQIDANYRSDVFHNIKNFDAHRFDSAWMGNARMTYSSADETWKVSVFVDNITDERTQTLGFDLSTFCGCSEEAYVKPRWWGVNLRYNFF